MATLGVLLISFIKSKMKLFSVDCSLNILTAFQWHCLADYACGMFRVADKEQ